MFPGPKGVRIADVTDGTSNTILFVEADDDHAVVWTAPDDLAYDPKDADERPWRSLPRLFPGRLRRRLVHFLPKRTTRTCFVRCSRGTAARW